MASGVYIIINTINGKVYVGSSIDVEKRFGEHKSGLRNKSHKNIYLQNAWNKYGEDAFEFKALEYIEESLLLEREQFWMDKYQSYNRRVGYNIAPIAGRNIGIKRRPVSQETRLKISLTSRGRKLSDEAKNKMRGKAIGRLHSEETKEKLRRMNTGNKHSDETKRKMRDSHKRLNGSQFTEERRKNISESLLGEKHPQAKLTEDDVRLIKKELKNGVSGAELGRRFGVARTHIYNIKSGRTWSHIV